MRLSLQIAALFTDLQALLVLWSKLFEGQHGTTTLFCLSLQVLMKKREKETERLTTPSREHKTALFFNKQHFDANPKRFSVSSQGPSQSSELQN